MGTKDCLLGSGGRGGVLEAPDKEVGRKAAAGKGRGPKTY